MTRFADERAKDTRSKEQRLLDKIEGLIEKYEDNVAGPYWTNRDMRRSFAKQIKRSVRLEQHIEAAREVKNAKKN